MMAEKSADSVYIMLLVHKEKSNKRANSAEF